LSANFKPKRTAAVSRGFLATARFSCYYYYNKIRGCEQCPVQRSGLCSLALSRASTYPHTEGTAPHDDDDDDNDTSLEQMPSQQLTTREGRPSC